MESMSGNGPKKEFKVHSLGQRFLRNCNLQDLDRKYGAGPKMVSTSDYDYGVVRNFYKTPEYRQYYQVLISRENFVTFRT